MSAASPAATQARVPTASGSRYLQQLCKHWSHRFAVTFDPAQGRVPFDNGATAILTAQADALLVRIEGPDGETVERMKEVVSSHLDRFAFREAPLRFDWED